MSKKPYDLGERDKPTRGLAANFRAKWTQADRRIRELEAEVARLKAQSRALTTVLEGEREKLRAVGELPGKWRDKTNLTGDTLGCKYGITAEECADELEALLKTNDESRTRPIQGGYLEKDTLTGEVHEPTTERDWTSDAWAK